MRGKNRILYFFASLFLLAFSLGFVNTQASATVKVKKVTSKSNMSTKQVYVAKGKKVKVSTTVTVSPNKKANKKVKYTIANKKIATISNKGIIKGKRAGKTKVTVCSTKDKKKKAVLNVRVYKKAVKKVQIPKTASGYVGDKITIKAKVTAPKGAASKVYWSSSHSKVATVTTKGVVKGVKAGTTIITATAADGSGKKCSCTVTVKNRTEKKTDNITDQSSSNEKKIDLAGLNVYNPGNESDIDTLQFSLTEAKALEESDIIVRTKKYADGNFNTTIKVKSIYTSDYKTYMVYLKDVITNGTYVSVTVNTLSGVKSLTVYFKAAGTEQELLMSGLVGDLFNWQIPLANMIGGVEARVSSGVLPSGLGFYNKDMKIMGMPTAPADNVKVTIEGTDELGTVSKNHVTCLIGSSDTVCAQDRTVGDKEYNRLYVGENIIQNVYVAGGSGSFTVSLLDDYDGMFRLNSESCNRYTRVIADEGNVTKAGTYDLQIQFTDQENPDLTAIGNLKLIISDTCTITAKVENNQDSPTIYFENEENGDIFSCNSYDDNVVTGNVPAGCYSVYTFVNCGLEKYILNSHVNVTDHANYIFCLPKSYNVTFQFLDKGNAVYKDYVYYIIGRKSADDENDSYLSYTTLGSCTCQLIDGSYLIKYKDADGNIYRNYFTVAGKELTINLKVNTEKRLTYSISGKIYAADGITLNSSQVSVQLYWVMSDGVETFYRGIAGGTDAYQFDNIPAGSYKVKLRNGFSGPIIYESKIITLDQNGEKDIILPS